MIANGANAQEIQTNSPQDSIRASINSGVAPLSVIFSGTVSSNSSVGCQGTCNETVNFGDGSVGLIQIPTTPGTWQSYTLSHIYQTAGQYTASLQSVTGAQIGAGIPITVGFPATVTAQNGSYGIVSVSPSSSNNNIVTIVISVPSCAAYQIEWGDGTSGNLSSGACTTGGSKITITHTYSASGSYTIKLKDGSGNMQTSSSYTIQ